jgi:hypothetical protein
MDAQPNSASAGWAEYQRRMVKAALNERFMLARRVEREGGRRILAAVVIFVGVKFLRYRIAGAPGSREA